MDPMTAACDHLDRQEKLNYAAAAREFNLNVRTLERHYTGKCGSRQEASSKHHQRLNDVEEDTLLRYIDELTNRHIPPTTQIVKNLAEEILGAPVGENWANRFVKRHEDRICSVYLKPIDHKRASAESITVFKRYFAIVLLFTRYNYV